MDIPRNPKEKFLADLRALIDQSNNVIKNTCDYLGWDLDKIQEKHDRYIFCPFDEGHWMPKESLEKHLQTCEWKALGYTKECVPLTESFLPANNPSTLKFDTELQQKVLGEAREKCPNSKISVTERFIPQTSDRLFSDFTTDERRAMYDYVVANTVAPDIGEDIADINKPSDTSEDKQSKTMLELLAQERNLKRRRAKYKGVHTNKKSHTEILREIIEQQLEMFKEHLAEKFGTSFPNDDVEAENKSTASSEKRLFKDRESSRNNPTHGRFYDENPSPRLSQLDRKDGHNNSHKDRYSRTADGHRSRDRDRHCHRSDEDFNNFHGKKHSSRADENRSKDRHRSSDSKNDSRERHRDEKYIKEHKSHKHENKYDKEQRAKHKRRSRSEERRKHKKTEKSRSRSRSRKRRNRSRSRNRRSRSKSN